MKKLFPKFFVAIQSFLRRKPFKAFGLLAFALVSGCIATENRIAAGKMREQVIRYYNDEIMENLIRASRKLSFVHVDVTALTTTDVAAVAGSVGSGHMASETRMSPMKKALHSFGRTITWPFAYSVTPSRSDSMQITANTVLGQFSPEPSPLPSPEKFEVSKQTITQKFLTPTPTPTPKPGETSTPAPSTVTEISTEKTPPKAPTTTIYKLYEDFLTNDLYHDLCQASEPVACTDFDSPLAGPVDLLNRPSENEYVEGTLRISHGHYYYIHRPCQCEYYEFCKKLFTKSQTNSVGQQFQALQNLIESVKGQLPPSVPQAPPP